MNVCLTLGWYTVICRRRFTLRYTPTSARTKRTCSTSDKEEGQDRERKRENIFTFFEFSEFWLTWCQPQLCINLQIVQLFAVQWFKETRPLGMDIGYTNTHTLNSFASIYAAFTIFSKSIHSILFPKGEHNDTHDDWNKRNYHFPQRLMWKRELHIFIVDDDDDDEYPMLFPRSPTQQMKLQISSFSPFFLVSFWFPDKRSQSNQIIRNLDKIDKWFFTAHIRWPSFVETAVVIYQR